MYAINFILLPLLFITMLCASYRPVRRLRLRGRIGFVAVFLSLTVGTALLRGFLPSSPFRVPAGAMEPTLRGTTTSREKTQGSSMEWFWHGKKQVEFRASASGSVSQLRMSRNDIKFSVGDVPHKLPAYCMGSFWPTQELKEGDVIWSGTVQAGDLILVDRLSYLFRDPRRGDIVVFSTDGISHKQVRPGSVYVKRIVGLPGETIRINPPHLVVDGRTIRKPIPFRTLDYENAGQLATPDDYIELGKHDYLVFGDNTGKNQSLDGRYFGAIPRSCIIGRVNTIYWPFSRIRVVE
ncbi:signal peptidase I [Pontiella desulfatans]|nr:signal peptidase I [Pontiella desulfatans]